MRNRSVEITKPKGPTVVEMACRGERMKQYFGIPQYEPPRVQSNISIPERRTYGFAKKGKYRHFTDEFAKSKKWMPGPGHRYKPADWCKKLANGKFNPSPKITFTSMIFKREKKKVSPDRYRPKSQHKIKGGKMRFSAERTSFTENAQWHA